MTTNVRIRNYRGHDLEPLTRLFNSVNGLTDTEKEYDSELMAERLSQPPGRPEEDCYLAESQNSLVGFALVCSEPRISRAVAMGGILESHRGQGIGLRLLKAAEDRARKLNASVLQAQIPDHDTGAHRTLVGDGFKAVSKYWQMRWEHEEVPPLKLPDGYSLRSFRVGEDELALTELQNAAFGENWGFCPNTVEEIRVRVLSKRCDPEGIIFVVDGDQLVAYNWTLRASNSDASIGWISMTGAHPDHRGKGLGSAAVIAGMGYLKARGVDGIELEVDADNVPAREMYLKLGFESVATTVWYEKRLDATVS